jgi:hypothetical protein
VALTAERDSLRERKKGRGLAKEERRGILLTEVVRETGNLEK